MVAGKRQWSSIVWDGDVLVHEIREQCLEKGDPVVEERTYWFEDDGFEPLAHRERRVDDVGREHGGWFHYVNDPIGTPERLLAEDGSIATEYERKAWGQLEPKGGAKADTPIRLQGQYWDEETGLAYNRWRYYDGEGTFTRADPILLASGLNLFAFGPSAFAWFDPLGLAKRGPKPKNNAGRGGPHNNTIMDRIAELKKKGWEHVAGGTKKETVIKTPNSATGRACRRIDITMKKRNGQLHYEQVGLETPGGDPVPREVLAMDDIENETGIRPAFKPYGVRTSRKKKK